MEKRQLVLDFIKKHLIAVISTVDQERKKPESAVLEFGENENFEIIFDTLKTSRKYNNLRTNKNVSFVIGWDENITIQYEGFAEEIHGEVANSYKKAYWTKNPQAKRWATNPDIRYFRVTPTWIRYSDLNQDPWNVFEITDF
jgi:general stress protein 26